MKEKWLLIAAAAAALVIGTDATASDGISHLAARLATLRGEVEALSGELEAQKEEHRGELRSFSEQKAELEIQLRREGLRLEQLTQARKRQRDSLGDVDELSKRLTPVALASIGDLEATVREGLPFRTEERLAELDKLQRQTADGLLRGQDAIHRVWAFNEDELRLARESGLYRQTIELDGEEILADVARIGMVALYFHTPDGRYGKAVRTAAGWNYQVLTSNDDRTQVAELFDAFKKQIRVGYFQLPDAFPAQEGER